MPRTRGSLPEKWGPIAMWVDQVHEWASLESESSLEPVCDRGHPTGRAVVVRPAIASIRDTSVCDKPSPDPRVGLDI
jgi:hypothetical protein